MGIGFGPLRASRQHSMFSQAIQRALSAAFAGRRYHSAATVWTSIRNGSCTRRSTISSVLGRSEEHTSELQSLRHLVCRLLLEKKKRNKKHGSNRITYSITTRHSN